jgi:predicted SAM-dependent methyltransferase
MTLDLSSNDNGYSICSTKYQITLKGILGFEIVSLYGRLLFHKKPKIASGNNLLHLGCGHNKFDGWVNADFYSGMKFWKKNEKQPDWMLDIRYPLNCDDNVWDGVFSEHTLEHLYPNQVLSLLKELYRTMKKGAWLRISVPDLKKYIDFYCDKQVNEKFDRWPTGCEAIRSLTQNFEHLSVWDSKLLLHFLKKAGFMNTREVKFMEGTDHNLLKDNANRRWESLYMEAQKK